MPLICAVDILSLYWVLTESAVLCNRPTAWANPLKSLLVALHVLYARRKVFLTRSDYRALGERRNIFKLCKAILKQRETISDDVTRSRPIQISCFTGAATKTDCKREIHKNSAMRIGYKKYGQHSASSQY